MIVEIKKDLCNHIASNSLSVERKANQCVVQYIHRSLDTTVP